MPSGIRPKFVSASRRLIPSSSRQSRAAASKRPASAREPVSVTGKRTPSSSPNATTSTAKGRRSPAA